MIRRLSALFILAAIVGVSAKAQTPASAPSTLAAAPAGQLSPPAPDLGSADAFWRTSVNDRLKALDDWRNGEAARRAQESSSPLAQLQTWVPIGISVISLLLSLWTYWQGQKTTKRSATMEYVLGWRSLHTDLANVRSILEDPDNWKNSDNDEANKSQVEKVGNWYDSLARDWENLDGALLSQNELGRMAALFWGHLQDGKKRYPAQADWFNGLEKNWTSLKLLASRSGSNPS